MNYKKHHKQIEQYAIDCADHDEPWLGWRSSHYGNVFVNMTSHPEWDDNSEYERVGFTLATGVPEPFKGQIKDLVGMTIFVVNLDGVISFDVQEHNKDDMDFRLWKAHGFVHLSKRNAETHLKLLLDMSKIYE